MHNPFLREHNICIIEPILNDSGSSVWLSLAITVLWEVFGDGQRRIEVCEGVASTPSDFPLLGP